MLTTFMIAYYIDKGITHNKIEKWPFAQKENPIGGSAIHKYLNLCL